MRGGPEPNRKETLQVNTSELVTKLTEAHGVSKAQVKAIVDDFLKDIVDAAARGAEVSLPGFGKFKVKEAPEREGEHRRMLHGQDGQT